MLALFHERRERRQKLPLATVPSDFGAAAIFSRASATARAGSGSGSVRSADELENFRRAVAGSQLLRVDDVGEFAARAVRGGDRWNE